MIERLKWVTAKFIERSADKPDLPPEAEAVFGSESQQEFSAQDQPPAPVVVVRVDADYCAHLLRFAMSQEGQVDKYKISGRWLRMTLAGLEGRSVGIEEMWEGEGLDERAPRIYEFT